MHMELQRPHSGAVPMSPPAILLQLLVTALWLSDMIVQLKFS